MNVKNWIMTVLFHKDMYFVLTTLHRKQLLTLPFGINKQFVIPANNYKIVDKCEFAKNAIVHYRTAGVTYVYRV